MRKKIINFLILALIFFVALQVKTNVNAASSMAKAQKGKILLQVEANGEAWYVNPGDEKKYFMGRPDDAFSLMRQLGVGINNENLQKIKAATQTMTGPDADGDGLSDLFEDAIGTDKNKADTDGDGYSDKQELEGSYNPSGSGTLNINNSFSSQQKGKIFLQVEGNGEAWYVNPSDNLRYFMGRPADAFSLMRSLGLGITNSNLNQIATADGSSETTTANNSTNNNSSTDTNTRRSTDSSNEYASIITAHHEKITEFLAVYKLYQKEKYETLVSELFASDSQKQAKDITDEFFISFVENSLKKINNMDLNAEYDYALEDDESVLPLTKTNDSNFVVGLGIDFIMPYELKNESGTWKIDLAITEDYYNEIEKIDEMELDAEGSEVEVYLMKKLETALKSYKTSNGSYPAYINQVLSSEASLKDYIDDFEYAVNATSNPSACHFGIDVDDDESKLSSDADFDSLSNNYEDGFDGADPMYDKTLN